MPWYARNDFTVNDKLHADDLNFLAHDDRVWGGNVDGGGYTLSNVQIVQLNPLAGGGGVTSFNTRNGDVMPLDNGRDYTAAMVNAVPVTRLIVPGPGITVSGSGQLSSDVTIAAAVQSFNTRIGAITLTATDVSNATGVLNTRRINTALGSGLQNGGPLSADLNLSVVPNSTNQQIQVMSQGSPIGAPRPKINFVSSTGALVVVTEVGSQDRIDVTVSSTGTGGFVDPTQVTGDLIVRGLTAPATRLAVGTDGQVLTADHLQALGVKWAAPPATNAVTSVFGRFGAILASAADGYTAAMVLNAVDQQGAYNLPPWIKSLAWNVIAGAPAFMLDPTVAKGDLIVHAQTGTTRLIPGLDGSILMTDSTLPAGVKWGAVPMISFNTRGGAVVPGTQDYTVDMIAGAVPTSRAINTILTSGLTGGGPLSGNLSLSVVPDTTNQQIEIWQEGITKIGTRHALNFKSGAGVALTIADSPPGTGNNWINITIASSGSGTGGGLVDPTTAKGDLIVRPSTVAPPAALPVGANGTVLTADATQGLGMRWAVPSAGGAGSQSPWLGPIDAANNVLNNASGIGVNIASDTTKARVYAFVNALEDGFQAKCSSGAGLAAASFINNAGDSLTLRSYGTTFVGGLPGLASIEASNILAIFANSAEVMRLKAGRVLIGTTTDDNVNKLQVNGTVKSKTGGFVFPDGTTQLTAFTTAASAVTSVFTRTGAILAQAHDYTAALVDNAVDSTVLYNNPAFLNTLAWSKITGLPTPALLQDPTTTKGDLIARATAGPATRLGVGANNTVLMADTAAALGVKWAAPPAQTPWTTDVDAAGHTLFSVGRLGVGNDATVVPDSDVAVHVIVGSTTSTTFGEISMCGNTAAAGSSVGQLNFCNYNLAGADKRLITIAGATDGAPNSGQLIFYQWNAGVFTTTMQISAAGTVGIGNTPQISATGTAGVVALQVGGRDVGVYGDVTVAGNTTVTGSGVCGRLNFANYNIGASEKRTAAILGFTDGLVNSGRLEFYTAAAGVLSNWLTIKASGNIGMGTSLPNTPLDVYSAAGGNVDVLTVRSGIASFGDGPGIIFNQNTASNLKARIKGVYESPNNLGLSFWAFDSTSLIERMRIMGTGNVGFGLTNPQNLLHVYKGQNSAVTSIIVDNNGTGVGTAQALQFYYGASTRLGGIYHYQTADRWMLGFKAWSNSAETERLTIDGVNGNTGIGTQAPAQTLHVQGTGIALNSGANANYYRLAPSADQTAIRLGYWVSNNWYGIGGIQMDFTGNVGIGIAPAGGNVNLQVREGADQNLVFSALGSVATIQATNDAVSVYTGMRLHANGVGINVGPNAFALNVGGSVNVSGGYFINGLALPRITAYLNQTGARGADTTSIYQNGNGVPIFVACHVILNSGAFIHLRTDLSNPPTNIIAAYTNTYTNTAGGSVCGWVMPGHYYRVYNTGGSLVTWFEWT